MAHITMLESIGLLTADELQVLLNELKNIYASAERGEFIIEDGIEDVHSQVELMLKRKLGAISKKIHSGRSRNDQVLVDLKLFTREQLKQIVEAVADLFHVLISQSNKYKDVLMTGYTHLQIAMPSSLFSATLPLRRMVGDMYVRVRFPGAYLFTPPLKLRFALLRKNPFT